MNMHGLAADAAALPANPTGEALGDEAAAGYQNEHLAQEIAQSLSDSGAWSDDLTLVGPWTLLMKQSLSTLTASSPMLGGR